jgi:hypothetical protein
LYNLKKHGRSILCFRVSLWSVALSLERTLQKVMPHKIVGFSLATDQFSLESQE